MVVALCRIFKTIFCVSFEAQKTSYLFQEFANGIQGVFSMK